MAHGEPGTKEAREARTVTSVLAARLPQLSRRQARGIAAATLVVAAFVVTVPVVPVLVGAQSPVPAAVPSTAGPTVPSASQSVTLDYTARRYVLGSSSASERAGGFSYALSAGRTSLTLDGSSADFRSPGRSVTGFIPTSLRANVMIRPGDTVSVFGRTRSQPGSLDTSQTAALAVVGSSLVDLQSLYFGAQAMLGARATFAFPVGTLVLSVRGGVKHEPRPSAAIRSYWLGTTVEGGATLLGNVGLGTLSVAADITRSTADSLGGNNLYPGGGSASLIATLDLPFVNPRNADGDPWDAILMGYWISPVNASRTDQPNLLLPVGTTTGLSGMLTVPVGAGVLRPTLDLMHTASNASLVSGRSTVTSSSTGWATIAGLSALLPLSSHIALVPQAGYTVGNASLMFTQSLVTGFFFRRGRAVTTTSGSRESDAMRGWSLGVALSASF